ncbi:MAG TPA: ATP-binding protein [Albitalea sp.]|uniref:ATP-binding protein n=1 Tax=Piscinibacter sp. TaxID=1903157 RepID=UPI002ED3409C
MEQAGAGMIVAIVGAESTGKTTLAAGLRDALAAEGRRAALVSEYLREFCDRLHRTPVQAEQAHIAFEQTRRIAAAAATHDVVIADTSALMIAVYSELVFADTSLYAEAEAAHRHVDLTLLTALDLPWQADGHQRDGEQVREPVDALVRASLQRAGAAFSVVSGQGDDRLSMAIKAVQRALDPPSPDGPRWQWVCERCGDIACERHLLPRS